MGRANGVSNDDAGTVLIGAGGKKAVEKEHSNQGPLTPGDGNARPVSGRSPAAADSGGGACCAVSSTGWGRRL